MDKYSRHPRTLDGRPISAGISGFSSYSTDRVDAPDKPAPALSPADLLAQLNELKRYFNYPELTKGLALLVRHVRDTNNPHKTNLDDFTQQIADLLYQAYREAGGTGSQPDYVESLFNTLRVATLEEMSDSENANLLISVAGARQYLDNHENDPNAHISMLANLFPGDPPATDPVFSIMSEFGVSKYYMYHFEEGRYDSTTQNRLSGYSFVDVNRRVRYLDQMDEIPGDYSCGEALIPCFSERTNYVLRSGTVQDFRTMNVNALDDPSQSSPDEKASAIAVVTGRDTVPQQHSLFYPSLTLTSSVARSFSCYAKAVTCRYLAIHFKDLDGLDDSVVYGIYDLQEGVCITHNHMNRYSANIVKLADDWYRCEFTMSHMIGQTDALYITFFQEKQGDGTPSLNFRGNNDICGYLWGFQLENGTCASPYIPTNGEAVTRRPVGIKVSLDSTWWLHDGNTIYLSYRYPNCVKLDDTEHPLATFVDAEGYPTATIKHRNDGQLEIARYARLETESYTKVTPIYLDVFDVPTVKNCQVTHGYDLKSAVSRFNETDGVNTDVMGDERNSSVMYIGCDPEGNFLEGYLRVVTVYQGNVTPAQAAFLNGEAYHE